MKKRISILLASILSCTTLLTGCGGDFTYNISENLNGIGGMDGIAKGAYDSAQSVDGIYVPYEDFNTEEYTYIEENGFVNVADNPLSTFAADVDTGSYCNLRRMISNGRDLSNVSSSIRTEEIINYFDYDVPTDEVFGLKSELAACPWNEANDLLIMTVQANSDMNLPSKGNNFVFLIDVSGSMDASDKIEMVTQSFKLLASTITENDSVSVVTYSGESALLLKNSNNYKDICDALNTAEKYCKNYGGGTNGSGGIEAAYKCAEDSFIDGGNNRVIIASDGDMNLGITSNGGLVDLIKEEKESGIFLTVLGYGEGNYSDTNMESIADAGNGNYYYIDNLDEAERVLVDKLKQTTVTVAKDVKFQAEFNPAVVASYRQIGYENRQMSASDFSDDKKDGGEVGSGQQVTVVYEISYTNGDASTGGLKYQDSTLTDEASSGDILTLSIRYKNPDDDTSQLLSYAVNPENTFITEDFDFIAGVIELSMIIRNSEYIGSSTLESAYELAASGAKGNKCREEFCELIKKYSGEMIEQPEHADEFIEEKETVDIAYIIHYDKLVDVLDAMENIENADVVSISKGDGAIDLVVAIGVEDGDKDAFESALHSLLSIHESFDGIEEVGIDASVE